MLLKTSKITNFQLSLFGKRSRDISLGPLEPWNFLKNLVNIIVITRSKNHMHRICRFFTKKSCNRGDVSTFQMPLMDNAFTVISYLSKWFWKHLLHQVRHKFITTFLGQRSHCNIGFTCHCHREAIMMSTLSLSDYLNRINLTGWCKYFVFTLSLS